MRRIGATPETRWNDAGRRALRAAAIWLCSECRGPLEGARCRQCGERLRSLDGVSIRAPRSTRGRFPEHYPRAMFDRREALDPGELLRPLAGDPGLRETWVEFNGGTVRAGDWRYLAPPLPAGPTLVLEPGWGDAALTLAPPRSSPVWAGFTHADRAVLAAHRFDETRADLEAFLFDPNRELPVRPTSIALAILRCPTAIFPLHSSALASILHAVRPGGFVYAEERNRWVRGHRRGTSPRNLSRFLKQQGFRTRRVLARLPDLLDPVVTFDLDDVPVLRGHRLAVAEEGSWASRLGREVGRWGGYRFVVPAFGVIAQKRRAR